MMVLQKISWSCNISFTYSRISFYLFGIHVTKKKNYENNIDKIIPQDTAIKIFTAIGSPFQTQIVFKKEIMQVQY